MVNIIKSDGAKLSFPEKFIGHSMNIDYITEDYKIDD